MLLNNMESVSRRSTYQNLIDFFAKIAIFIYIFSIFVFARPDTIFLVSLSRYFFVVVLSLHILLKGYIRFDFFSLWAFLISLHILASSLWAVDINQAIHYSYENIKIVITGVLIYIYVDSIKKINYIINSIIVAGLGLGLYILSVVDYSTIFSKRLELVVTGMNSNYIGLLCGFAILMSIYNLKIIKQRYKLPLLLIICLLSFIIIITGSRKALFFISFGIPLITFLLTKKKKMLILLISFAFLILVYNLVMNIPELYQIVGARFEELINGVTGRGSFAQSSEERFNMIKLGLIYFSERPFLGSGIGNFAVLLVRDTGMFTYSHNNFIEVLTGLGLLGFFIYYSMYYYIISKLYITYKHKSSFHNIISLFLSFFALLLLIETGFVSIGNSLIIIIIAITCALIKQME